VGRGRDVQVDLRRNTYARHGKGTNLEVLVVPEVAAAPVVTLQAKGTDVGEEALVAWVQLAQPAHLVG
jgi:hypothetical protein